jgi:transcriptional regulator with XRE-family HTH domain
VKKTDNSIKEFAQKVRLRRHELDLSQEKLAERAHCHATSISRIEKAEFDPRLTTILKLAKALHLSPKDLMPEATS